MEPVRKWLERQDTVGVHRRGPHQMRHTFASLPLQEGAPITYVSQQAGPRDAAITSASMPAGCPPPRFASWIQLDRWLRAVDLARATLGYAVDEMLRAAVVLDIRFRDLRHRAATLLLAQGVDPRTTMQTPGYSQISLTLTHLRMSIARDGPSRLPG